MFGDMFGNFGGGEIGRGSGPRTNSLIGAACAAGLPRSD